MPCVSTFINFGFPTEVFMKSCFPTEVFIKWTEPKWKNPKCVKIHRKGLAFPNGSCNRNIYEMEITEMEKSGMSKNT